MTGKSNHGIGGSRGLMKSSVIYSQADSVADTSAGTVADTSADTAADTSAGAVADTSAGTVADTSAGAVADTSAGTGASTQADTVAGLLAGSARGSAAGSAVESGVQAVAESVARRNTITELPKYLEGLVIWTGPGNYLVHTGHGTLFCKLKGSLRKSIKDRTDMPVVGDRVTVKRDFGAHGSRKGNRGGEGFLQLAGITVQGTGLISAIHPRETKISRISPPADPWGAHLEQVLAANVNQLVVVASCVAPLFKIGSIERYLMIARQSGVLPVVCVNKVDLLPQIVLEALIKVVITNSAASDGYSHLGSQFEDKCQWISKKRLDEDKCNSDEDKCKPGRDESAISQVIQSIVGLQRRGIPLILTSAETGLGVSELQKRLVGGTISVFLGPSGAGKTSLLKRICPDYESKTLEISSSTSKGRHSTTYSTLVDIGGGYVADTPGLRAIGLWQLNEETVKSEYEDIEQIASQCRFRDCSHTHEPGCAVKAAVAGGLLDARRFERYLKVMGETVRKRR